MYMNWGEVTQLNDWVAGKRVDYSKQGYNNLTIKATSPEVVIDLAQQITDMGYQAYTPQSQVQSINSFFTIMQVVFGGVGAIALLVAAIGIANTMAMAILERTREIGIMKAIGATNNNILSIFLGEAAGIGFLGGVGGFLLGWATCGLINLLAGSYLTSQSGGGTTLATSIPVWLPLFSIAFATLVGFISGLYPALSAATLIPVDALKYE
jgi:putative ABC transport system permease protein